MFLYPLAIVLILLTMFSPLFKARQSVYAMSMFLTFFVSVIDGYKALVESVPGAKLQVLESIETFYSHYLPLYDIGLGWAAPAVVGAIIGLIYAVIVKK